MGHLVCEDLQKGCRRTMKIYLTYEEIQKRINENANIIRKELDPHCIVAISNGGLIPAMFMAKALSVYNVQIIGVKSYEKQKQSDIYLYQDIDYNMLANKRILVIDDIHDTGTTFRYVVNRIVDKVQTALRLQTYAVCLKRRGKAETVDHYSFDLSCNPDAWVQFPWED
jgi:hypoxanthine phosphoribosyltransferase